MGEGTDGNELGSLAGGGGEGGDTAFESSNSLFKDIDGGLVPIVRNLGSRLTYKAEKQLKKKGRLLRS